MKLIKLSVLIIVALAFVFGTGLAEARDYKGKAVVPYKPKAFSKKPSDEFKHKAIEKATNDKKISKTEISVDGNMMGFDVIIDFLNNLLNFTL